MVATEQLIAEHRGIKLMLDILEEVCKRLGAGEEIKAEHLEKMHEFFTLFADKCHHAKEEDILFPEMGKMGVPKEGGPIGVLLAEHKQGREYVKKLGGGIAKYKIGGKEDVSRIIENAEKYIELLNQHIQKEDNVLYPMADKLLSEKKQKEMLEEFEKIETERIGAGTHEKFHELLHHLKEEYLR